MMENEIRLSIPKISNENYTKGGVKQELVNRVLDVSREGQFVSIEKLKDFLDDHNRIIDQSMKAMKTEVRFEIKKRLDWILEDGEDSVAHLAISADTMNFLGRLTVLSVDGRNFKTISGARSLILGGEVRVRDDAMSPVSKIQGKTIKDLNDSITQFDKLAEGPKDQYK